MSCGGGLNRVEPRYGVPERVRTFDLKLRRLALYPTELRARTNGQGRTVIVPSVLVKDGHPRPGGSVLSCGRITICKEILTGLDRDSLISG